MTDKRKIAAGVCVVVLAAMAPAAYARVPGRLAVGYDDDLHGGVFVVNGTHFRHRVSGGLNQAYLNTAFEPDWSPDGEHIAFVARQGDVDGTYRVDEDGSDLTRLSRSECYSEYDPQWSPDGSKIAFRHDTCERMAVWMMNADGSNRRNVKLGLTYGATWRPDGKWIAFTRRRIGGPGHKDDVYVARPNGTDVRQVTHGAGANSRHEEGNSGAVFSPDGRWIAFIGGDGTEGSQEICIVRFDGIGERCLTNTHAWESRPAWSPNSRKIVFEAAEERNVDIYRVRRDGENLTRLTSHPRHDGEPVWSPRGGWIAFISKRDGNGELYLMRPTGSTERRLTRSPGGEIAPEWKPKPTS
jgi:Tol biopolymer transport system component